MDDASIFPATAADDDTSALPAGGQGTRGSISLRVESTTRKLIDDAAMALGKTRTEFMIETVRLRAIEVLLDRRLFVLEPDRYAAFIDTLDNAPAPGPKLRKLLDREPLWRS